MNEIATQQMQLPDTLEDLSKFIIVGRARLTAVRDAIKRIRNIELAVEVHEQKLQEAQEIAEAVLDAETKLGELTSKMEKKQGFASIHDNGVGNTKTKQLEEIGINQRTAERFEKLAKHPEVVEQAKADARAEGRIVTRSDVLNRIAPPKSQAQTMREVKKKAYEEHQQFNESQKESVINMEDIQKDKLNKEIVTNDIKMTIHKAIRNVLDLSFLRVKILDESLKTMSVSDKERLQANISEAIRVLSHISKKIGG